MSDNPYAILGVPHDATPAAVRHAYLELAKECHPDWHPNDPTAAARFKEIQPAFQRLYKPWRLPFIWLQIKRSCNRKPASENLPPLPTMTQAIVMVAICVIALVLTIVSNVIH